MNIIDQIVARAKANKQRIVLPESLEERTITAADKALADDIADIILIGNEGEIKALAAKLGLKNIDKATIIDPATSAKTEEYANLLFELRKSKGMTIEDARKKVLDPLYFGCLTDFRRIVNYWRHSPPSAPDHQVRSWHLMRVRRNAPYH